MTTILLVEDNELIREMLSRRLTKRGFELLLAADGRQGMDLARQHLPDLILMDIGLPEVDGCEATRTLKADPATSSIPLIILTAHATTDEREQALKSGCDDFATKPIDFPQLLKSIESFLTR
jgi:two-component system, cell cycle response regulator DivK